MSPPSRRLPQLETNTYEDTGRCRPADRHGPPRQRSTKSRAARSRLTAIRSFFRHVAASDPSALALAQRVLEIPSKRMVLGAPRHLSASAVDALLTVLLHVLPTGFHRIRYYGFLGARHRREKLARCRQLLGSPAPVSTPADTTPADAPSATDYRDKAEALTAVSLRRCPACHHGQMILIEPLRPTRRAVLIPDTS